MKNRRDCEELSIEIQLTTSKLLSHNTIRRFFGLDKNQYTTRKQTLIYSPDVAVTTTTLTSNLKGRQVVPYRGDNTLFIS